MKCPALPMFATLCYLRNRGKVLLLRKARGLFGEEKWNAPGGKLLLGENSSNGAAREMFEETGLRVSRLRFNGILSLFFVLVGSIFTLILSELLRSEMLMMTVASIAVLATVMASALWTSRTLTELHKPTK